MPSPKRRAITLVLPAVAVVIAGCGGSGGHRPAGPSTTPSGATTATAAEPAAPSASSSAHRTPRHDAGQDAAAGATAAATVPQPVPAGSSAPAPRIKGSDGSIERFGVEAPSGDAAAIATLVSEMKRAWAVGDAQRLCDLTATSAIQPMLDLYKKARAAAAAKHLSVPAPTCSAVMQRVTRTTTSSPSLARALRRSDLIAIRVKGDRGFALLRHPGTGAGALAVVREDGRWKAAALPPALLSPIAP